MKKPILEYVADEMAKAQKIIEKSKTKMQENYCVNFEWGYCEDIFRNQYIVERLTGFFHFVTKDSSRTVEWLNHNIGRIQERLFRGEFLEKSTSESSRIAHRISLETDAYLRQLYVEWLELVTEQGTPIA
jgi:hypothetical protein